MEESTEGTEPADTEPVVDTGDPVLPVGDGVACYLGVDRTGDACLDVFEVANPPSDYDYPAPLSGSPQYAEPSRYLDLDTLDPELRLAPNFKLGEVAQDYKGQFAVVQTRAIEQLQDLRDELGALVINSGYRSPAYNADIGGATYSRHTYGDAFDIAPVSVALDTLADACEARGAGWVGVYVSHIHCDWRDDAMDSAFYPGSRSAVAWSMHPDPTAWIVWQGGMLEAPAEGWDEGEPLREWTAFDAQGQVLGSATGERFLPPPGTVEVEVVVGRAVTTRIDVR